MIDEIVYPLEVENAVHEVIENNGTSFGLAK